MDNDTENVEGNSFNIDRDKPFDKKEKSFNIINDNQRRNEKQKDYELQNGLSKVEYDPFYPLHNEKHIKKFKETSTSANDELLVQFDNNMEQPTNQNKNLTKEKQKEENSKNIENKDVYSANENNQEEEINQEKINSDRKNKDEIDKKENEKNQTENINDEKTIEKNLKEEFDKLLTKSNKKEIEYSEINENILSYYNILSTFIEKLPIQNETTSDKLSELKRSLSLIIPTSSNITATQELIKLNTEINIIESSNMRMKKKIQKKSMDNFKKKKVNLISPSEKIKTKKLKEDLNKLNSELLTLENSFSQNKDIMTSNSNKIKLLKQELLSLIEKQKNKAIMDDLKFQIQQNKEKYDETILSFQNKISSLIKQKESLIEKINTQKQEETMMVVGRTSKKDLTFMTPCFGKPAQSNDNNNTVSNFNDKTKDLIEEEEKLQNNKDNTTSTQDTNQTNNNNNTNNANELLDNKQTHIEKEEKENNNKSDEFDEFVHKVDSSPNIRTKKEREMKKEIVYDESQFNTAIFVITKDFQKQLYGKSKKRKESESMKEEEEEENERVIIANEKDGYY